MTTGSEPGPEMFVVVTVNVAAVRLQHARLITEHRRQEYAIFIAVSFQRNTDHGQKEGALGSALIQTVAGTTPLRMAHSHGGAHFPHDE